MMRSNLKPPLARSPIRLRPRRVLQSTTQTPPGSLMKTQKPIRADDEEMGLLGPGYRSVSCDLRALAKMLEQDFGRAEMDCDVSAFSLDGGNANRSPLFERGRFYEEYARRRNERLKKKRGEKGGMEEKKAVYDLGVRSEVVKRRGEAKKFESARKGMVPSTTPVIQRKEPTTASRYLLRSATSKENKKPPLTSSMSFSSAIGEKKIGTRRVRRI